jgi:hypothetical protein
MQFWINFLKIRKKIVGTMKIDFLFSLVVGFCAATLVVVEAFAPAPQFGRLVRNWEKFLRFAVNSSLLLVNRFRAH